MAREPQAKTDPALIRTLRSGLVRWLAVIVLTPLLVLGALGGATVLAHHHDDRGLHLHAPCPSDAGGARAPVRATAEQHAHPCFPGPPAPVEDGGERPCDGSLVALPDLTLLQTRAPTLRLPAMSAIVVVPTVLWDDCSAGAGASSALSVSRAGWRTVDPPPMSARLRLLRTSRALLL